MLLPLLLRTPSTFVLWHLFCGKCTHTESSSVVDGLFIRDKVLHCPDFLRGVSLPIQMFADDAQRVLGAVGLRWITRKLSVGNIGIIHERPGRFYHVDPARAFALCQFRSPGSR